MSGDDKCGVTVVKSLAGSLRYVILGQGFAVYSGWDFSEGRLPGGSAMCRNNLLEEG